jgi:hypothetical protein
MGYLPYDVPLKSFFWIVTICFLALVGILFIFKTLKISKEEKFKKDLFRTLAIFFLLNICMVIFLILSDFERDAFGQSELHFRLLAIGYIFLITAYLILIVIAEKYIIKKTRHVISIITSVIIGLNVLFMIFFPNLMSIARYINYGLMGTASGISLLLYIYLIYTTTGDLRKIAVITIIGLTVAMCSAFLNMEILTSTGLVLPYYSPILFTIGLILITYVLIKKEGFDAIEMLANHKITALSSDFWEKIELFDLDEKDRKEFIKDMLGLTPNEREEFLNEMVNKFQRTSSEQPS